MIIPYIMWNKKLQNSMEVSWEQLYIDQDQTDASV